VTDKKNLKKSETKVISHKVQQLTVTEINALQRVDNFLVGKLKGAPKSLIYRVIRKGEVRINGKRCKPEHKLVEGDIVRVPPLRLTSNGRSVIKGTVLEATLKSRILYHDEHLLVLNKPAGMPVHAGTGSTIGVIEALRAIFPEYPGLELVHRLDKGTSGCLLLTLTGKAKRSMMTAFRERQVHKVYELTVAGHWPDSLKVVDLPLEREPEKGGQRLVKVAPAAASKVNARSALTLFKVLAYGDRITRLEAEPQTGRTHQIRVHAAASGYPLLGDDKYHSQHSLALSKSLKIRRLMLHASCLSFRHPEDGHELVVRAPE
jgi:23S rRNA pseudouridine955/2504/2580 synthase